MNANVEGRAPKVECFKDVRGALTHFRISTILLLSLVICHSSFAQAPSPPAIRDIAPPIDIFPYPPWMIATACGAALLLGLLAIWLIVRALRNKPAPAPPTPLQIALARLEEARAKTERLAPYEFSILVSDILRTFVTARFGLRATQQTSPEFLASLSHSAHSTHGEKTLLAAFLEKADLIKFARIDATRADSEALLEQAIQFVKGSAHAMEAPIEREVAA